MKKISLLTSIIATIFCSILLISNILAWFTGIYREDFDIDGRVNGGYFAGGTGEATNPYIITNKKHMRNLALLQNNGKFNTGNDIYYFKIGDDVTSLDMSGIWIPPIGNTSNPFKGNFDGNSKIIDGLRVTTNENLSGSKVTSSEFSDVGFFGTVADGAAISSFTLNDIYVDHNINTSKSSGNYSGIIAGEAPKDSIQYVGVHTARLGYQENKTADSNFALIGNTEAHTMTVEDPGGDTPGGDDPDGGDTGHFIPDHIFSKASEGSKKYGTVSSNNITLTNSMWLTSNKDNSDLELGSFSLVTGSECYIETNKSPVTVFRYYKGTEDYSSMSKTPYNKCKTSLVYTDTGGYVDVDLSATYASGSEQQSIKEKVVNFGGGQKSNFSQYLYCKNSPENPPKTLTVVDEHNQYINETGSISNTAVSSSYNVMNNCIKVNIVSSNAKIFVIAQNRSASSGENNNRYVGIYKLCNTSGSTNQFLESNGTLSEAGYIKAQPQQGIELFSQNSGTGNVISSGLYACEFSINSPGVYGIASTNSGINFFYLSVTGVENGDIGGGTEDPTSTVSYISTVDFVDSGVIITDTYEDYSYVLFIVALPATNSETVIYFKRDDDDDGTNKVYYGTSGNGTVTNVNTTYQGTSFTDFTDYPQVSADVS